MAVTLLFRRAIGMAIPYVKTTGDRKNVRTFFSVLGKSAMERPEYRVLVGSSDLHYETIRCDAFFFKDMHELGLELSDLVQWSKPPQGIVKLNVEAGFRSAYRRGSTAAVLRDDQGDLIFLCHEAIDCVNDSSFAECKALEMGLRLVRRMGYKAVMIETDNSEMARRIAKCRHRKNLFLLGGIDDDKFADNKEKCFNRIMKLIVEGDGYDEKYGYRVHHNFRESNQVADFFAQTGVGLKVGHSQIYYKTKDAKALEPLVKSLLLHDKLTRFTCKWKKQHQKRKVDDDLLLCSEEDRRLWIERPSPCSDFNIPMDCVGDLLIVWDFCASFGTVLNLSPFSLEDFENSLCFKDSTHPLIVESCSALLRLLVKDNGKSMIAIESIQQKQEMSWIEDLCDFLETTSTSDLSTHISTIKQGYYGQLDIHVKLAIFGELVARALETDAVKDKWDEYIEKRQASRVRKNEQGQGDNIIKESKDMNSAEERKKFLREETEMRFIQANLLGKDRNYFRYWFFDGRIFVERSDSKKWGYYQTKEELDALIGSLNSKGKRERALKEQLLKFYNKICLELKK